MVGKVTGMAEVLKNLQRWAEDTEDDIAEFNKSIAGKAKSLAREEARWKNWTGQARGGLNSDTDQQGTLQQITLFHSVIYGKYLELSNDGKFAILEETLNSLREEWIKGVKKILKRRKDPRSESVLKLQNLDALSKSIFK